MPGLVDNRRKWAEHNWDHGGHRWSPGGTPNGTDLMWWRSVRPRIRHVLPTGTLLEIAPGAGRWTAYLLDEARALLGVDVTPACVEACRARFAGAAHAQFWTNDGQTLPMVAADSVDVAISLDSLVHVEIEPLSSYLHELARTLRPGGVAFLHHSNLGAYARPGRGIAGYVAERHWRAETVSAARVRQVCRDAGLSCVSQEAINWIGRDVEVDRFRLPGSDIPLTDCFTLCARQPARGPTKVYFNWTFVDEWRQLIDLARVYTREAEDKPAPDPGALTRASTPAPPWRARLRARANGTIARRRDPARSALRARRCPDCHARLGSNPFGGMCVACHAVFRSS